MLELSIWEANIVVNVLRALTGRQHARTGGQSKQKDGNPNKEQTKVDIKN